MKSLLCPWVIFLKKRLTLSLPLLSLSSHPTVSFLLPRIEPFFFFLALLPSSPESFFFFLALQSTSSHEPRTTVKRRRVAVKRSHEPRTSVHRRGSIVSIGRRGKHHCPFHHWCRSREAWRSLWIRWSVSIFRIKVDPEHA